MEIRQAETNDITSLCELLDLLFEQEIEFKPNRAAQFSGLTEIIKNEEAGRILVVENKGKIAGMVNILFTVSTALGGRVAILEDMVVAKDERDKGFGAALLQAAVQTAKELGCKRITLLTDNNNVTAQNFYMRNGFSHSPMIPMRLNLE